MQQLLAVAKAKKQHLLGLGLFLLLALLIWIGYEEIDLLRGTPFWPYRYLVLALLAFAVLTLVQRLYPKLERLFSRPESS